MPATPSVHAVLRADDAAMSRSANAAIRQVLDAGCVRNVSVMAVGPELDDAARRLAGIDDACVGLHVTLTAEWSEPRYRPVLPAREVPSLVGEDGCFPPSPTGLAERPFDVDEAMAEIDAQLRRLREAGLSPVYLDEHMGVGYLPGLRDRLDAFCRDRGLLPAWRVQPVHVADADCPSALLSSWARILGELDGDRVVFVVHPLAGWDEDRRVTNETHPPGLVAVRRNADRLAAVSPALRFLLAKAGVRPARYTDVPLPPEAP